jgi:SnoaL-like domain
MSKNDIEKRITVLEDIEAIKRPKARYCAICDDDHNPDKIATMFAEDGIWEGGDFGRAQGHQAIRKLFEGFQRLISFSQHNLMNPNIEVEATARRVHGT